MLVMRALSVCLAFAAFSLFSANASAQADDEARARGHFEAASSYFEEGEYEDALREFTRAYELSHRPGLLYNIGLAHERLANYSEAARFLSQYLRDETDEIPNRTALEHRVETLERRAEDGTTDPIEEDADPGPQDVAPPHTAPDASSGGTDLTVPAIVAFSVGGAGLVMFGIAGGIALAGYTNLQDTCGGSRLCSEGEADQVRLAAGFADAGIALAAVGVVTGIVLLVLSDPGDEAQDASSQRVQLGGWAHSGGGGVVLAGAL